MANKAHEEIPGNPSTATSSKVKLNDGSAYAPYIRVTGEFSTFPALRCLVVPERGGTGSSA